MEENKSENGSKDSMTGCLGCLGVIGIIIASIIGISAYQTYSYGKLLQASDANLRSILKASLDYAEDNEARLPGNLAELKIALKSNYADILDLPHTETKESRAYGIVPGIDSWMASNTIFAYELSPRKNDVISVITLDGKIRKISKNSIEYNELMYLADRKI